MGTLLVATLYLGLTAVFIYAMPLEAMKQSVEKGQIAIGSLAASRLFGPEIAGLFGALMAVGLVSTVNAMVTIGPRVYYAMAKNRAFFKAAAQVDERWHTPVNAIVAQGIVSVLMTFVPFGNLFFYISITLNLFAGLGVASLFVFRKRPGWRKLPVVSFLFPLVPGFFLLVSAWMYYVGITVEPMVSLATALTVGMGALIYHFRIRPQN
jgi:APA family basic amino acid/polyamine antiporter